MDRRIVLRKLILYEYEDILRMCGRLVIFQSVHCQNILIALPKGAHKERRIFLKIYFWMTDYQNGKLK